MQIFPGVYTSDTEKIFFKQNNSYLLTFVNLQYIDFKGFQKKYEIRNAKKAIFSRVYPLYIHKSIKRRVEKEESDYGSTYPSNNR